MKQTHPFLSRKLLSFLLAVTLSFIGALLCIAYPGLAAVYPTLTAAIVGALATYVGSNILQKKIAPPGTASAAKEEINQGE